MNGTVYFIQAEIGGPIKIGYTAADPKTRLGVLQTASPERLKVIASCPGSRRGEQGLHHDLREHRLSGEWFTDCDEVRAAMAKALAGEMEKPKARRLSCGCVEGYVFCDAADAAWRSVGLARLRGETEAYARAIKEFGEHSRPRTMSDLREEVEAAREALLS